MDVKLFEVVVGIGGVRNHWCSPEQKRKIGASIYVKHQNKLRHMKKLISTSRRILHAWPNLSSLLSFLVWTLIPLATFLQGIPTWLTNSTTTDFGWFEYPSLLWSFCFVPYTMRLRLRVMLSKYSWSLQECVLRREAPASTMALLLPNEMTVAGLIGYALPALQALHVLHSVSFFLFLFFSTSLCVFSFEHASSLFLA